MERLIFSGIKSDIAPHIQGGLCATDARVISRVNEAQRLLIDEGIYAELKARYSFCQYDGCITLPRELEAILGITIDKTPTKPQNMWYEFLDGGPGEQTCDGMNVPLDRGNVVTYRDICGSRYIRVYCDLNEDADAVILIRGLDENGNQVMTFYNGSWIDGEYISLAPAYPKVSTRKFSYISSVVKPSTEGFVRLYSYDADTDTQTAIALYAPNELYPTYRRYLLPSLAKCESDGTTPESHAVTVLAKKRFIPVAGDNDDLFITNTHALICAVKALEFRDNNDMGQFATYLSEAKRALGQTTTSHEGGNVQRMNIQGSCFFGGITNTQ